jgi:hypothetical protein
VHHRGAVGAPIALRALVLRAGIGGSFGDTHAYFPLAVISLLAALAACSDRSTPTGWRLRRRALAPSGARTLIATDAGFEAPDHVASGMRQSRNRGAEDVYQAHARHVGA